MEKLWNFEQLLGLSPDHFTIRSGQGNAKKERWLTLGNDQHLVWGEFNNKGRAPFLVLLNLNEMQFSCNCSSKKFPCQHMVGLHLLWYESADLFTNQPLPKWARAYQTRNLQRWHRSQLASNELISSNNLRLLQNGLSELERWLHDLVQNGIATLTDRKKEYWVTIANRMADIQAMALSQQLTDLSKLGQSKPDWPETYLKRISPLAIMLESFKRFEQQSENAQADLLTALGRPFPLSKNGRLPKFDQWLVLGHLHESIGQQQQSSTWLWGLNHNQPAQVVQLHRGRHPVGTRFITGTILSGQLKFLSGSYPLTAQFVDKPVIKKGAQAQIGTTQINPSLDRFKAAKTQNPWLDRFPMVFRELIPVLDNSRWFLLDDENYCLPLPKKFHYGWHLAALASDGGLTTFGLWDGTQFEPLSIQVNHVWIDLHTLRGIK
ncbi:MAG: hypothetical protein AAF490_31490 [Chloroflexota bacterium]